MNYLALVVGGLIGGALRYVLESLFSPLHAFPLCTLVINLVGAFVLGSFYGIAQVRNVAPWFKVGFGTGCIGAFTTFSTFCLDIVNLDSSHVVWALLYVLLSLICGPLLAYLGDRIMIGTLGRTAVRSEEVSV